MFLRIGKILMKNQNQKLKSKKKKNKNLMLIKSFRRKFHLYLCISDVILIILFYFSLILSWLEEIHPLPIVRLSLLISEKIPTTSLLTNF